MCNAITHPAQREAKMIEGFYGKGKRREHWVSGFGTGVREFDLYKIRTIN